ncbi:unnamed protein product [Didymodactylos carnosus]|uniref:Uncharacterized protein n=1 Tax=Didymodactylos carnosus TaxID=1234261 RepID=A0A8S2CMJ6_9BILA|nr:unnamed protein product [Didymodactylos carnosus]CAF3504132.1 unnamed protein product [Didymodactylos carnosus]
MEHTSELTRLRNELEDERRYSQEIYAFSLKLHNDLTDEKAHLIQLQQNHGLQIQTLKESYEAKLRANSPISISNLSDICKSKEAILGSNVSIKIEPFDYCSQPETNESLTYIQTLQTMLEQAQLELAKCQTENIFIKCKLSQKEKECKDLDIKMNDMIAECKKTKQNHERYQRIMQHINDFEQKFKQKNLSQNHNMNE